jgi:hypothetical protein
VNPFLVSLIELQSRPSQTESAESTRNTGSPPHNKDTQSAKRAVEFIEVNRDQAKQATGLLTGHCNLKGNLFKLGITDSPICGRCQSHMSFVSVCVALIELRFCHLSKHFMEPSIYDEIPLCKIMYFIGGLGLLAE